MSETINYESIVAQLKKELNTDCALANRYGIVLSSNIDRFPKENIIPQKILELIGTREAIAGELKLKQINSFAFESEDCNYLFTFSKELILISKVDLNVNLAKFMPSVRAFTEKLSDIRTAEEIKSFLPFDFSKDIAKIEATLKKDTLNKEKYSIIKELIKYIST